VKEKNISACRAIEHHLRRPAFMVSGQRLYLGSLIVELGAPLWVTRLGDKSGRGDELVACEYHDPAASPLKVKKRHVFTKKTLRKAIKSTN
jgi:hypothetical protein